MFYPSWAGETTFTVQLYIAAHAAEALAREVDTLEPGPAYAIMRIWTPWRQA